jgi:hypothetical protein
MSSVTSGVCRGCSSGLLACMCLPVPLHSFTTSGWAASCLCIMYIHKLCIEVCCCFYLESRIRLHPFTLPNVHPSTTVWQSPGPQ